ncbi:hypothetical protein MGWOODY_Mmi96 [hydrothermal vent metagenome]|uniref:Uncharacterized protein n=1 Tax=hydrothermal vent metagenome TaxID=652676 RepID=A0A160VEM0_9ZZZZ
MYSVWLYTISGACIIYSFCLGPQKKVTILILIQKALYKNPNRWQ